MQGQGQTPAWATPSATQDAPWATAGPASVTSATATSSTSPSWTSSAERQDSPLTNPGGGPIGGRPSWAHDSTKGLVRGDGQSSPAEADHGELRTSLELKKSRDVLRGRKRSGEITLSGSHAEEQFLSMVGAEVGADQIASFMRIADDAMRARGMSDVVATLRAKIEGRDEAYLCKCVKTIVRLSVQSAFATVRSAFAEVVTLLKAAALPGVQVPDAELVSRWIPGQ
jgi:hypothetical protein